MHHFWTSTRICCGVHMELTGMRIFFVCWDALRRSRVMSVRDLMARQKAASKTSFLWVRTELDCN
jgi:hypothetical protein